MKSAFEHREVLRKKTAKRITIGQDSGPVHGTSFQKFQVFTNRAGAEKSPRGILADSLFVSPEGQLSY